MVNIDLSFYPDRTDELELEPDTKARLASLSEQIDAFRNSGPLDDPLGNSRNTSRSP